MTADAQEGLVRDFVKWFSTHEEYAIVDRDVLDDEDDLYVKARAEDEVNIRPPEEGVDNED